jgi:hypothetical protein
MQVSLALLQHTRLIMFQPLLANQHFRRFAQQFSVILKLPEQILTALLNWLSPTREFTKKRHPNHLFVKSKISPVMSD